MTTPSDDPSDGCAPPRRHDRVWLVRDWRRFGAEVVADRRLDDWVAAGRAFVTRRRDDGSAADTVPLAVALPLAEHRVRLALAVGRRAIARVEPPLALAEVAALAIPHSAALRELVARGIEGGTTFCVYGSYAWQTISGEPCVTPTSDLDLLWDARDPAQVARVIALLSGWEREHGIRADGEVRFADGGAVAWREIAAGGARVLVKRDDGVAIEPSPLARRG